MDVTAKPPSLQTYLQTWLKIAAVWLAVALFDASRTVFSMRAEGMHHAWERLFITLFLSWLPWALATPMIVQLGRRYPRVRLRPSFAWLVHLSACGLIAIVWAAWVTSFDLLLNPFLMSGPAKPFLQIFLSYVNSSIAVFMILYAAILAFSLMWDSSKRLATQQIETARLNEKLIKAQLSALQRQIEPHFLFNALNAIAGTVREKRNEDAITMIVGLSEFLREVVKDSSRQQVPLAEEMEFVQKYLAIQKVRFAERLQLSVAVPEELYPAQVPRLILQPLVENAFKHGIAKRAQGGALRIAASRSSDRLTLRVYNDGPKLAVYQHISTEGVGISNLRSRMESLYGDAFELSLCNQGPGGVEVSVSIPFKAA